MNPIHTSTRLDLARADAADRQRRAAEYRLTHDHQGRPRTNRRAAGIVSVLTLVVSIGVLAVDTGGGEATARALTLDDTAASTPLQHGYEQGMPDGWWDPAATPRINRVPRSVR